MSNHITDEERDVDAIDISHAVREDLPDIDSLAKSIEARELLHPIVITPDNVLIAGRRRLAAFKMLDRKRIPVRVHHGIVDIDKIILAQRDENDQRVSLNAVEKVHQARPSGVLNSECIRF